MQTTEPNAVVYSPAAHGVQVGWPAMLVYVPAVQFVQVDAPAAENVPAGQDWHAIWLADGLNLPASHKLQAVEEASDEKVPFEQAMQDRPEPYVPGWHCE